MNTNATVSRPAAQAAPVPASIRLLRCLKPVVVAILRSRLHGLLSRDVLLLHYRGRRSGRAFTLPLSFVEEGGDLYLCTRPGASDWWRNLKGGAEVELTRRGRRVPAAAEVLDPASPEALEGLRAFVAHNPGTGELLYNVARSPTGPNRRDLEREVLLSVVVRVRAAN